ncbi:hypothetical protein AVEN_141802-1 [Araneus ventricosus]|uniref:Uncharacterized protein n=1 Tax=Araneus ventricosus TaxID=182803 RepID=A0A4Y2E7K3_ARAVE|nr:hypothetical protein AVEN_141802-1 [Araneus ventricosus]
MVVKCNCPQTRLSVNRLIMLQSWKVASQQYKVLSLGRGFYKVKHGVTSATLVARMHDLGGDKLGDHFGDLAANLAIWRQIDYYRKYNPFLDISNRGRDLGFFMKILCDVTANGEYIRPRLEDSSVFDRLVTSL